MIVFVNRQPRVSTDGNFAGQIIDRDQVAIRSQRRRRNRNKCKVSVSYQISVIVTDFTAIWYQPLRRAGGA